jgi:hypothetical protein
MRRSRNFQESAIESWNNVLKNKDLAAADEEVEEAAGAKVPASR